MNQTFQNRIERLGIQADDLGTIVTKSISDIEELKKFLDQGLDEKKREAHLDALQQGISTAPESEAEFIQHVEDYLFGNRPLSSINPKLLREVFPLNAAVVAAENKVVDGRWDLTTEGAKVVSLHIGTLTLKQGGYIIIEGQPLELTVDRIIRDGDTGDPDFLDINILGKTGHEPDPAGTPASPGRAATGSNGNCDGELNGGTGSKGDPGATGNPGKSGGAGIPSLSARIFIKESIGGSAGTLSIQTYSGAEGKGGKGGQGATGGAGGHGGKGGNKGVKDSKGNNKGSAGNTGGSGTGGNTGSDSTVSGTPAQINVTIL